MIQNKLLLMIASAMLLSCFGNAPAQQNSVAITPASIDAKVKRGTSYTQTFTLNNNTGTRLRFKCSVADVWYDENNRRLAGRPGTLPRSASLWVQFFPAEVIVGPRSSGTVKAIVTVPVTAAGGYYSVPVFDAMPADPLSSDTSPINVSTARATIGIRLNGLMMFTTFDTSEYNVEIMGGQISPPTAFSEFGMQLDVRNRSTAHVGVRGAYAILNAAGALAGRGTIEVKRYLPGQRKTLQSAWAGELKPGIYTCVTTLSYNRVGLEPATLVYELPFEVK